MLHARPAAAPPQAAPVAPPAQDTPDPAPAPELPVRLSASRNTALTVVALIVLVLFVVANALWPRLSGSGNATALAPQPRSPRLVVLPFQDLSAARESHLSDGVTEEITSQLARIDSERLAVIARTSAEKYRGKSVSVAEIGRDLGADYLLEGSVQRVGDTVRVHAQLIRAVDQTHLWAESFDRPATAWMTVQSDVARRVARALAIELLPGQRAALDRASTTNAAAAEAFQLARGALMQKKVDSLDRAEKHLLHAIELDPNYALAYASLAETYGFRSGPQMDEKLLRQSETFANKALEIDPMLSEGYSALAQVAMNRWQWTKAEEAMQRALRLNGNDGRAIQMYAKYLGLHGRYAEALHYARRAVELDPHALGSNGWYGWMALQAGKYRDAQAEAEKLLALGDKRELDGHWMLGSSLLGQGRIEAAVAELEKAHSMNNQIASLWVDLATAYWQTGQRERALTIARDLEKSGERFAFLVATMYARFQMREEALTHLERAYESRNASVLTASFRPEFSLMRNDPRFRRLQQKIGQLARSNN